MINPQWIRSFGVLAELGSFTRAADQLGVTQAAVSQHIRQLEQRLGLLLIRRSRGIELTPAGRALLDYGTEIDQADRRLRARLDGADAKGGEVGIITPGSLGLLLYPLLLDLQEADRGLVIRHRFAPDHEVLDAILKTRFELGIVTLKPDDPRITASPFTREPLELVVPAGEEVKHWSDLERLGFIDHPDGQAMAIRLLSLRFPRNPGVRSLPIRGFTNQVGLILAPVARGFGFTVIPRYARLAFAQPDAIRVVDGEHPIVDTLWLIHRAEWPLSAHAEHVVARLRGLIAGDGGALL
ncbi:LysR family transcriptional regulator [Sphingobium boeckii]|uniref:DNA-binding transcriptional LysR family regulator n=1 Tax=Sphingobium boeckii TaxID=1082345 RepID=A0A7W9EFC6_9SPHN|nr:LysR family transcriptional regulator [Sphingobium boeckii]MBB5685910.1 DNA-binding transcriptional LysR family regulator [Sphingobium boeckii]